MNEATTYKETTVKVNSVAWKVPVVVAEYIAQLEGERMSEKTNTGASDLRKRYWQEHGKPPEGPGPHPDHGPAYIPWLEALVARLEAENERLLRVIASAHIKALAIVGGE